MHKYHKITKLSPAISTENIGDKIIMEYCDAIFDQLFPDHFSAMLPTRDNLGKVSRSHIASADYSFVCGTNLLSSHMKKYTQWNITPKEIFKIWTSDIGGRRNLIKRNLLKQHADKNRVILLGVGWWQYQEDADNYTKRLLNMALSKKYLHSVRDAYTEQKLRDIGITNVVNTACPTMWNLNWEHCKKIPTAKSNEVITTLTNYNLSKNEDNKLLEILLSNYDRVYVWLQAIEDYQALTESPYFEKINIISPTLKAYDDFLDNTDADYIGTRLHGGIRALNKMHRTTILAVDNRAVEIAKDTNLPVIKRGEVCSKLDGIINSKFETKIRLPLENIEMWKNQFT